MEIILTNKADTDLLYWKKTNSSQTLQRIRHLLASIIINPFQGIGKPEALKHNLSGKWSRRIDRENRIIYEILDGKVVVHSLKGHY